MSPARGAADLVLRNGTVWQHDAASLTDAPRALAVRDGRIVALGPAAEALAGEAREVVDLDGGALLPGFGDGHAHPVFGGLGARFAPVRGADSVEGVLDAVGTWAAAHPEEPWVRGEGYDPTLAPGGVFDARWLDAVVSDRPVWLRATDYHTAWVNTRALELAGITAATPDPADGEIVRRPDGTPAGTLREWGAWRLIEQAAPALTTDELASCLVDATRHLASLGVTWVQDAWVEPEVADAWLTAVATGELAVRGNLALLLSPATWRADLDRITALRQRVEHDGGGQVTARSVKLFADGVIEAGTGALLAAYDDCPHSHGLPNWEWPELTEAVVAADALGFQPHLHAIGDAAVRASLDAVEEAIHRNGARDRRAVVAHAQLVQQADRPRFGALGVIANFEPLWACPDDVQVELTEPRLGPDRSRLQYPIASLLRAGPVSFGSDWPVSSADPREGLAVAVTRQLADGTPPAGWIQEERVGMAEAVTAYTRGVAVQAFEDDQWGSLVVGARADLVHLAADPRLVRPHDLPSVAVLGTWLGGRRTS